MSEYKIELLEEAVIDLKQISNYYLVNSSANFAVKKLEAINNAIRQLRDFPKIGTRISDDWFYKRDYRKLIIDHYAVIYRILDKTIFIYTIVNTQRDFSKILNQLDNGEQQ